MDIDERIRQCFSVFQDIFWYWPRVIINVFRESILYILISVGLIGIIGITYEIFSAKDIFSALTNSNLVTFFRTIKIAFITIFTFFLARDISKEHRKYRSQEAPQEFIKIKKHNPDRPNEVGISVVSYNPDDINNFYVAISHYQKNEAKKLSEEIMIAKLANQTTIFKKGNILSYEKQIYGIARCDDNNQFTWLVQPNDIDKLPIIQNGDSVDLKIKVYTFAPFFGEPRYKECNIELVFFDKKIKITKFRIID